MTVQMLRCFLIIIMIVPGFSVAAPRPGLVERLQNADRIYVAPLRAGRHIAQKAIQDAAPTLFQRVGVDQYRPDEEYAVGDLVQGGIVDLLTITGEVSTDSLAAVNLELLRRFRELAGEERVEFWPQDRFRKRHSDLYNNNYDTKAVECDFYVVFSRPGGDDPMAIEVSSQGDSSPDARISDTWQLTLYEKTKPGRRGKKVLRAGQWMFDHRVVPFRRGHDGRAEEKNGPPTQQEAVEILTGRIQAEFESAANRLFDQFFQKIRAE